jgi:hypothetical protein
MKKDITGFKPVRKNFVVDPIEVQFIALMKKGMQNDAYILCKIKDRWDLLERVTS